MLIPLTPNDSVSDRVALCSCFVFSLPPSATEEARASLVVRVKEAAQRAVEKWKMLQGTPEWTRDGVWAIRVPEKDEQHHLEHSAVGFSTATYDKPYHLAAGLPSPLPPLSSAPSSILPVPQLSFFRPPTLPGSFSAHAKHAFPLVHVHVSLFSDSVAVGIFVPHAVFDGTGIGLLNRALSAELHGEEWEVPPKPEDGKNPFVQALEALEKDEAVKAAAEQSPPPSVEESWTPMSFFGVLCFVVSILWETYHWKAEARRAFFRKETLEKVVEKAKKEVEEETEGEEYVSTGDVMLAWLMKASLADEAGKNERIVTTAVYSARSLLAGHAPTSLSTYGANLAYPYQLISTPISLSTLSSTPLPALALSFRRNLPKYRNLPTLLSSSKWMRSSPTLLPARDWPSLFRPLAREPFTHRWLFSNQASLGMADFALPFRKENGEEEDLPLTLYHLGADMPMAPDHMLAVQSVPGGGGAITMSGNMRRSRWEALQRAIREIEAEGEAPTDF
ncbi:hypothetical protein JCM8547_005998 [Rhodosporidiobolus lusitaniae]